jgi:hypothetical protein
MSHLGERVTSLVDGQLPMETAERALMHLAGCADCREVVEAERLMKQRLASLGAPEPGDRLVSRLLELSGPSGPLPPRRGHVPGSPRPQLIAGLTGAGLLGDPARSDSQRAAVTRPPGRRGSSRPPLARTTSDPGRMVRVSRSSRNRMAAAMVGAACLVGAGVAGGVANGGVATTHVVPPVDSFVLEHSATAGMLPFADQTVVWGAVGAGR